MLVEEVMEDLEVEDEELEEWEVVEEVTRWRLELELTLD